MVGQKRKTSARKPEAGRNRHEPVGSKLEEARHIAGFSVSDARVVHVGTTTYGGPVIVNNNNITIRQTHDREELLFATSVPLAGDFADLSIEDTKLDLATIMWLLAISLRPSADLLSKLSTNSGMERRSRHTRSEMGSSDTRQKPSTDSLSEHRETQEDQDKTQNQGSAKTVMEKKRGHQSQARHKAGDLGQPEMKNDWGRRLRNRQKLRDRE